MTDRLSSAQLDQLTGPDVLARPRYTLEIDSVDFSDRVISVGNVKWKITNRHPTKRGALSVPILNVELDNRDGLFAIGNAAGPWATDEARKASVIQVTVKICSPVLTVLDFTGGAQEPFYDDKGMCSLGIQHPLEMAKERVWKREDQSSDFETGTTITRDATP